MTPHLRNIQQIIHGHVDITDVGTAPFAVAGKERFLDPEGKVPRKEMLLINQGDVKTSRNHEMLSFRPLK